MKAITKKSICISLGIIIISIVIFFIYTCKSGSKIIILENEPDGIFSSPYSNKLAVITDGELVVYNQGGKAQCVETGAKVIYAYPLEDSIYVIDEKNDLFELGYEERSGISNKSAILSDVKMFTYSYDISNNAFSCGAISTNGDLYVWGSNENHILGIEDEDYIDYPIKIEYLSNIKKVCFGEEVALLLTESGEVYQAGNKCYKSDEEILKYSKLESITGAIDISCGDVGIIYTQESISQWIIKSCTYHDSEDDYINACEEISFTQYFQGDRYWVGTTATGEVYFRGYDIMCLISKDYNIYNEPVKMEGISNVDYIYAGNEVMYVKNGNELTIVRKKLYSKI